MYDKYGTTQLRRLLVPPERKIQILADSIINLYRISIQRL